MRKKRFPVSPGVLAAAVCLFVTLFGVLPRAGRISAAVESAVGALTQEEGKDLLRLRAAADAPSEARAQSVPPLEEPEETEAAAVSELASGWETPADILEMEAQYLADHADSEPAGTVYESFFTTGGATDVLGDVAIRNCTDQSPDFAALLRQGAELAVEDPAAPAVLVFHTHTTESYLMADNGVFYADYSTRSASPARSVVRVGDALCAALEEAGIGCIHDTEIYDEAYTGAYARSREGILRYLEAYPSIRIVLDVHRDAIYDSDTLACKPTAEIRGRKAAQIMVITGVEEGAVTDFPGWEKNLRFALSVQEKAQEMYRGLMKPIYFCRRKYNMDVTPCSLLLEFGSDTNTLEEAVYAGRLFGQALAELIHAYA